MGGVESHLYQLSQRLIQRGHKVIIITHSYGNRTGIRYLTNGLKVYYVPHVVIYSEATLPTIYGFFPIFRNIVLREKIDIVHGHQAFSSLCNEAILHARTMGMKACFTDHSLFGFADSSSILMNKLLKFSLSDIDHVICVSHTSKENTVLRAALNPQMVSVIPNAVLASQFKPDPGAQDPNFSNRLVYRKGMDLLVAVIPRICQKHPKVRFIIGNVYLISKIIIIKFKNKKGGDGPKRVDLEQMREKYLLHDRVELLGAVKHHEVRNVLTKGQIFLNTSLTEAFCIGIVEAACCGLLVVSTKVGGVPEVLPRNMIIFAKPEEEDLVNVVIKAIEMIRLKEVNPIKFHDEIKEMYSWVNIAERTEKVYDSIWKMRIPPLMERLRRYYGCGVWAGKIFCVLVAIDFLLWRFLEWIFPESDIDIAPSFPYQKYRKMCQMADKDDDDL
ncbi:9205_t:CDS:10 [Entrophospora sp. SA101]|nr:9205_t:CDS:10 [Entrophospora sp. SA101]